MALDIEKLNARIEKIAEDRKGDVTKEGLTAAVSEAVTQHVSGLESKIGALEAQLRNEQGDDAVRLATLEGAVERLADALDGDDTEEAKKILGELEE